MGHTGYPATGIQVYVRSQVHTWYRATPLCLPVKHRGGWVKVPGSNPAKSRRRKLPIRLTISRGPDSNRRAVDPGLGCHRGHTRATIAHLSSNASLGSTGAVNDACAGLDRTPRNARVLRTYTYFVQYVRTSYFVLRFFLTKSLIHYMPKL